jgi:hypothetical protein
MLSYVLVARHPDFRAKSYKSEYHARPTGSHRYVRYASCDFLAKSYKSEYHTPTERFYSVSAICMASIGHFVVACLFPTHANLLVATKKLRDFAATKDSIDLCTHIGKIVNKTFKSFFVCLWMRNGAGVPSKFGNPKKCICRKRRCFSPPVRQQRHDGCERHRAPLVGDRVVALHARKRGCAIGCAAHHIASVSSRHDDIS